VLALEQHWPTLASELGGWLRDQHHVSGAVRSWLKVAKLACLTNADVAIAEQDLWRLKYSRAEVQAVVTLHKVVPLMQELPAMLESRREQYFFFKAVGSAFPAAMVLALASETDADKMGEDRTIGTVSSLPEKIAPLVERFLDEQDPVAHPSSLLTGRELMHGLHLSAGPRIGQLLGAIQLAHAEGKVNTAQEALGFASILLEKSMN
jgi:tRNA nucleotidyltransferase (CCA-adding enzyme)